MLKLACIALLALAAQPFGTHAMGGGESVTDANTYSYQVAIQPVLSTQTGVPLNLCSGIIVQGMALDATATTPTYVAKYYVLTAASCLATGLTYNLYMGTNVVQAITIPDITGVARTDVIFHPEFLTSNMQNSDLAIITADAITTQFNAPTNNKRYTAASLPTISTSGNSYLTNTVNMAGWGYPYSSFPGTSPRLRQLNSWVVANWYCSVVNFGKPVTNRHICTGGLINKGPCTGDAGAPLILRSGSASGTNRVIGLATLVPVNGCSKSKPGVFTRLGSYMPWIMQITNYQIED